MDRTKEEIYEQIDKASERIENGETYSGMTYEEGIKDALEWITGDVGDDPPLE